MSQNGSTGDTHNESYAPMNKAKLELQIRDPKDDSQNFTTS
jgi:hypothetical protein